MSAGRRYSKIADWAVIVVFLGAIALPLAGTLLPCRFDAAPNDLRPLASWPPFALERRMLIEFPDQFEQYWNDHFAFRGILIRALNIAKVRGLRVSTSAHVLLGRATWLFYTTFAPGTNYNGVRPFTTAELDQWQHVLEQRRDWLERRGCRYLVFIPPDKQTIYPEYLSPVYQSSHAQSRLDQLLAHLREHGSKVEVLDIRQPMRAVKTAERLYHRTDSHWNDRGAFIGYQHLVGALSRWFPQLQPAPRWNFEETTTRKPGGDLATMVDLAEYDGEEWLSLVPRSPRRAVPRERRRRLAGRRDLPAGPPVRPRMRRFAPAAHRHVSRFILLRPRPVSVGALPPHRLPVDRRVSSRRDRTREAGCRHSRDARAQTGICDAQGHEIGRGSIRASKQNGEPGATGVLRRRTPVAHAPGSPKRYRR